MKSKYIVAIIALFLCVGKAEAKESFLIDDFDSNSNALGAASSTYEREPSKAMSARVSEEYLGDSGRSLAIQYNKKKEGGPYNSGGWCGYYTILKSGNEYFDASGYKAITFYVKGTEGNENFKIGLADKRWEGLGDSVKSDQIGKYLAEGKITTNWQKATISLSAFLLEKKELASLAVCFENECFSGSQADGTVYIDDLKFESELPYQQKKTEEAVTLPKAEPDPGRPRSLWVWKLDVLGSESGRKKLFDLCESAAISNLYVYFGDTADKAKLAEFLKEAHAKNLKVEALNGKPSWAFEPYHNECLEWIKAFKDTDIDGISLDVEPYLTSEWQTDKQRVCSEFLGLLKKARAVLGKGNQKIRLGVAVATLYSQIDNGKFVEDILKSVDYVAVMDYYDSPNRIVEEAEPYLVAADKLNKKVVVGVETQDLVSLKQGDHRLTFFEEGWEQMEKTLGEVREKLKGRTSFEGFAIHCDYSYMALQKGRNAPVKQRPANTYTVKSIKKPGKVKIDANLSDWNLFEPFIIDKEEMVVHGKAEWLGTSDLSAKAWSMWDGDSLYFAFYITDDKVVQDKSGKDLWEGDHIEVWLDTDLEGDYNEAINSNDDRQFGFSAGNFNNIAAEAFIWVPDLIADRSSQIQIASSKTENGYIVEVRIPASILNLSKNPEKGARFGISIDPSDTDDPAIPQKALMSSSPDRQWGDPTTFGILELQ